MSIENLITDHLETWTAAQIPKKTAGRGNSSNGQSAYGIKKLRELILELAVRGKLVPQDPDDEPASVLLKKIEEEKTQLVKEGNVKYQKPLPEVNDDEKSFDLPEGWEWQKLGNIIEFVNGFAFKSSDFSELGVGIVKIGDIQSGEIQTSSMSRVDVSIVESLDKSLQVATGEMLIAMSGATTGKLGFNRTDEVFYINQRVGKISPYAISVEYLYYPLTTKIAENLAKSMGSAIPNLSTQQIKNIVIAIPPLVEQHRIVAKVDELMALCDKLEQEQSDNSETHQLLVKTLLDTLTTSTDHQDFIETWQQIEQNFDILLTTEASIDELKQTILQLAVMGKLVPQDPNDEPASVLLEKIAKEKARLVKEGKIKKQKPLPPIGENEKPFELPMGWERVSLRHLGIFSGGKTPSKAKSVYWDGDIPWVTSKDMKVKHIIGSEDHVTQRAIEDGLAIYHPEAILFVVRSGILRHSFPVAVTKVDCTVNQDIKVLSLFLADLSPYIYLMMRGFEKYILLNLSKTGMTVESIMFQEFSDHYFILPPLTEQYRIVAKVDELMAICDSLKERLNDAQATQVQLADAIVAQSVALTTL